MQIRDLPNRPSEPYVLTTVDALCREQNGQHWLDLEAECYAQGEAPPAATIKVRYAPSPSGHDRFEASIHQGQSAIRAVGARPDNSIAVTPVEFD